MGNSIKGSIKKVEKHGGRGRMLLTVSHSTKNRNPGAQRQTHTGRSICPVHTDNQQLSST